MTARPRGVRPGDGSLHGPALAACGMQPSSRSTEHGPPLGSTGAKPRHLARKTGGLRAYSKQQLRSLERVAGIEPARPPWKASAFRARSLNKSTIYRDSTNEFAGGLSEKKFWSGRRESNPHLLLGRQGSYHYTTPAQPCTKYAKLLAGSRRSPDIGEGYRGQIMRRHHRGRRRTVGLARTRVGH